MAEKVQISAKPYPMKDRVVQCLVEAGKTLSELFPDISPQAEVNINGKVLPRSEYGTYQLKKDDVVSVAMYPSGSRESGKNIARTAALIAVAVASTAAGNFAGAQLGFSSALQVGVRSAVFAAGAYGVSEINWLTNQSHIRNDDLLKDFNRMGSLTGSRSKLQPYSVVPRVYGKHKLYPPMAASPYTEVEGNQQFLRLLLTVGQGPLSITTPGIGGSCLQ